MSSLKIAKFVWFFIWKPVLQTILILITLFSIPFVNVFSSILCVLVWVLVFKLFSGVDPDWSVWWKSIWQVSLFVGGLYYLVAWLGGFGLLGVVLILLLLSGWRLYSNWRLFDYTTSWGAKRLFKGSSEEFDAEEAFKK